MLIVNRQYLIKKLINNYKLFQLKDAENKTRNYNKTIRVKKKFYTIKYLV